MTAKAKPLIVRREDGRHYSMGKMSAVFLADGDETNSNLSVSEWWLEPGTLAPDTPNAHSHDEDHLYYVIEGAVNVLLDGAWHSGKAGTYIYIPGGTEHTFENRGSSRAGFISINNAGGFEDEMPGIVKWFKQNRSPDQVR